MENFIKKLLIILLPLKYQNGNKMNALNTMAFKNIKAQPQFTKEILEIISLYESGTLEEIMVGDFEEKEYFSLAGYEMSKSEAKAFNKLQQDVYKFHELDKNFEYVNQENHFKVYGYYEHD